MDSLDEINKNFTNKLQKRIDRDLGRLMVRLTADMKVHKRTIINVKSDVVKVWMEEVARGALTSSNMIGPLTAMPR